MALNIMLLAPCLALKKYPNTEATVVNIIFVKSSCLVQGLCTLKVKMLLEASDSLA